MKELYEEEEEEEDDDEELKGTCGSKTFHSI